MKVIERESEPLVTSLACPLNIAANFTPKGFYWVIHSFFIDFTLKKFRKIVWAPNFYSGPLEFGF